MYSTRTTAGIPIYLLPWNHLKFLIGDRSRPVRYLRWAVPYLNKMSPGDGAALPPLFLGGRCGAVFTHFLVVRRRVHTKYGARGIIFLDATLTLDAVPLTGQQANRGSCGLLTRTKHKYSAKRKYVFLWSSAFCFCNVAGPSLAAFFTLSFVVKFWR